MTMTIVPLYAGLLGLLYLFLAANVIRTRRALSVGLGDGGHTILERRIRAHGNCGEYAPIALVLYWATEETVYVPPRPPEVTYITTFAEGRSDQEIIASNEANQARNDQLRAAQEEIEEQKREMYRALGRATGIDVDAMEAQIEADRAREVKLALFTSARQVAQNAKKAQFATGGLCKTSTVAAF